MMQFSRRHWMEPAPEQLLVHTPRDHGKPRKERREPDIRQGMAKLKRASAPTRVKAIEQVRPHGICHHLRRTLARRERLLPTDVAHPPFVSLLALQQVVPLA